LEIPAANGPASLGVDRRSILRLLRGRRREKLSIIGSVEKESTLAREDDVYSKETIEKFLDDLASGAPTPGGGSSASLIGAVAAGLVSMVGHLTAGKEKFKDVDEEARRILARSEALRAEMIRLIQADIEAFNEVSAAYKMPRSSDEEKAERTRAIQASLVTATEAPLAIARAAHEIIALCEPMARIGNSQAISDVGVAALAADSCLQSAVLNMEINLKSLKDAQKVSDYRDEIERLTSDRDAKVGLILEIVRERL
jgi:formiminotetrahydrofolate cyclodeaminase